MVAQELFILFKVVSSVLVRRIVPTRFWIVLVEGEIDLMEEEVFEDLVWG